MKPIQRFFSLFNEMEEETVSLVITEEKKEDIPEVLSDEELIEKYKMNKMEILYSTNEGYTEYTLSGVNFGLIFSTQFEIMVKADDASTTSSEILVIDKKDKHTIFILPFYHSEGFHIVKYNAKRGEHGYEGLIGFSGIPIWEHKYIYGNERLSGLIKSFYDIFKSKFLEGDFLDLKGNTNYSFYLMFDLLKSNQSDLKKHLTNLMEHYPEVTPYCEAEMGKLGMSSRTYNGNKYVQYSHNVYMRSGDFQYKDAILKWLKSDEFTSTGLAVYVDNDGTINAIVDKNIKLYGNEKRGVKVMLIANRIPSYIHFGVVDGNFYLTNTGWSSLKNKMSGYQGGVIEAHPIDSLDGCPIEVKGDFKCENIGITSLKGSPRKVEGDFIVRKNNIDSFIGMPKYIGGCFNISDNEFTDEAWDYAKENIDAEFGDYKITGNRFIKYRKELS